MGMGTAKLVSREWKWGWERLDGNGRKRKHHISSFANSQVADHETLRMDSCLCIARHATVVE